MSRCTICNSPHRASIELGLANNVPLRALAKRFGVSKEAAYRHRKNHLAPQLVAQLLTRDRMGEIDLDKMRAVESEGLLHHLVAQRGNLYRMADDTLELGDHNAATRVHGALTRNLELTAKLLGDLKVGTTNLTQNILVQPQYHAIRVEIVQALKPFPEARQAVTAALQAMESEAEQDAIPA